MSTHDLANLIVVLALVLLFADWAVLLLFVAPITFPELTTGMYRSVRKLLGGR